MNRIEKSIIESFSLRNEQSLSELVAHTDIPKGTVKKYCIKFFLPAFRKNRYIKITN